VLKNAKFRCTLCGTPADEKALEWITSCASMVETNEISNLQALCYSCNAEKRDRGATDFRVNVKFYETRKVGCAFSEIRERIFCIGICWPFVFWTDFR
jgi:hypothetical protein